MYILSASWKWSGRLFCLWFRRRQHPTFVYDFHRFVYGFRRGRKHILLFCLNGFRRWLFVGFRRGRKRCFMVSVAGLLMDSAIAGGSNMLECIE